MTSLLSMLDRFEQAAVTYETSTAKADRDELHAARRAIMEAFEARSTSAGPVACPEDATEEMVEAALAVDWSNEDERAVVHNVWHAMRVASPPASKREAELVKALTRINERSSPNPTRTFDVAISDLEWITSAARAAIHPSLEQE